MGRKGNKQAGFGVLELIVILCIIGAAVFAGWYIWNEGRKSAPDTSSSIDSFEECAKAGNPVQESYPEVCMAKDGKRFTNPAQAGQTDPRLDTSGQPSPAVLKITQWGVEVPLGQGYEDLVYTYAMNETYEAVSFTFKQLQDKNMCKTDVGVSLTRQKTQNEPPFTIDNPQPFKKAGTYYYYVAYGGSPCYDAEKPDEAAAIKQVAGSQDIKQFVVDALKGLRVTDN